MKIANNQNSGQRKWVGQKNNRDRKMDGKYHGKRRWFVNKKKCERKMDGRNYNKGVKRQYNYAEDEQISASKKIFYRIKSYKYNKCYQFCHLFQGYLVFFTLIIICISGFVFFENLMCITNLFVFYQIIQFDSSYTNFHLFFV